MRLGRFRHLLWISLLIAAGAAASPCARAQEPPYFVAYGQAMEEPGNLEINFNATYGTQRGGNDYMAYWTEFEYGVRAGGPRSSISTGNPLFTTAPSSPVSAGRTVSIR